MSASSCRRVMARSSCNAGAFRGGQGAGGALSPICATLRTNSLARSLYPSAMRRADVSQRIVHHVVDAIEQARDVGEPFAHLELERVFPDDVYAGMLEQMPRERDYRPMSGRS